MCESVGCDLEIYKIGQCKCIDTKLIDSVETGERSNAKRRKVLSSGMHLEISYSGSLDDETYAAIPNVYEHDGSAPDDI